MPDGFANAVIGGAEFLIRSAIKSANYIAGLAGWRIARDGNAELNNATVRGSLIAGGGNVTLNSSGLHIQGSGQQFDINIPAGFLAWNLPDNGQKTQTVPGGLFLTPVTSAVATNKFASMFVGYQNQGLANEQIFTALDFANYNTKAAPSIVGYSQAANNAGADTTSVMQVAANEIDLTANKIIPSDDTLIDSKNHYYLRGENASFVANIGTGAHNALIAVTFTHAFIRAPHVICTISDAGSQLIQWNARAINMTTTGFTFFMYNPNGTNTTGGASPTCQWTATEFTP